ncbi:PTS glucitol/sorbitol transporter subunit IIA [Geosporobacter ferrireducens]|uniref:PTS sorbitol transporter subunit IIA n=1 Tax=Geosporobacter ferrireducens TaxID=1424294 RepID=A0A1D8GJQ3_9FIRM|nr:PTS glucitol/sorbitol transporter subunit IIA [Geosporobacter ferrireducens]AOT71134.1 PTS sorbitol transporter subunit IIA [Geosporobacter ferrireducens]MTI57942.1 PTS sorbitol transporter subunit IIA [Geosporobacter ferrireducens]
MKYQSTITGLGELALDFAADNLLILFNENAPAELAEISVLHTIEEVSGDIRVGDVIIFSKQEYRVTAVGEEANKTFRQMGHCTFKFTGKEDVELPGHIELQGNGMPKVKIGDLLIIK